MPPKRRRRVDSQTSSPVSQSESAGEGFKGRPQASRNKRQKSSTAAAAPTDVDALGEEEDTTSNSGLPVEDPDDPLAIPRAVLQWAAQISREIEPEDNSHVTVPSHDIDRSNTNRQYDGKIGEFCAWCKAQGISTQVTGLKAAQFLWRYVFNREFKSKIGADGLYPCRHVSNEFNDFPTLEDIHNLSSQEDIKLLLSLHDARTPSSSPQEEESKQVLAAMWSSEHGYATYEAYQSAVTRLFREQVTAGLNVGANHPRHHTKVILSLLSKVTGVRDRQRHESSGGTPETEGNGSVEQLEKSIEYYHTEEASGDGLRNALAHLLGVFLLWRSSDQLGLKLSDLSLHPLEDDDKSFAIVTLGQPRNGGKPQTLAPFMRNRNTATCPVLHLALYLFMRFSFSEERHGGSNTGFPSLKQGGHWRHIPLFVHAEEYTHMTDKMLRPSIVKAFQHASIKTKNSIHIWKIGGQSRADALGISRDSLAIESKWRDEDMDTTFTSPIVANQALKSMSGFQAKERVYYPRAVSVPKDLLAEVFPDLPRYRAHFKYEDNWRDDIQATTFIDLMEYLAMVLLQDAPHFKLRFPDLPIWDHTLFKRENYLKFEKFALKQTATNARQATDEVQNATPDLCFIVEGGINEPSPRLNEVQEEPVVTSPDRNGGMPQWEAMDKTIATLSTAVTGLSRQVQQLQGMLREGWHVQPWSTAAEQPPAEDASPTPGQKVLAALRAGHSLPTSPERSARRAEDVIRMEMPRVKTVRLLWTAYALGYEGEPAIKTVLSLKTNPWLDDSHRKNWSRRCYIVQAVSDLARSLTLSEMKVADLFDEYRLRNRDPQEDPGVAPNRRPIFRPLSLTNLNDILRMWQRREGKDGKVFDVYS